MIKKFHINGLLSWGKKTARDHKNVNKCLQVTLETLVPDTFGTIYYTVLDSLTHV